MKKGRPKKSNDQVAKPVPIRLRDDVRERVETEAVKAGFCTSTGRPKLGDWLDYASKVASAAAD